MFLAGVGVKEATQSQVQTAGDFAYVAPQGGCKGYITQHNTRQIGQDADNVLSSPAVTGEGGSGAVFGPDNTRNRQSRILSLDMPQGLGLEIDNAGIFKGIG